MKNTSHVAPRPFFLLAATLLLLLAVEVTAYGDCSMTQPGDLEGELSLALDNRPSTCQNVYKWRLNNDPSFGSWGSGGSQNLPVVTAAVGLYRSGPNAYVDRSLTAAPSAGGYKITYLNWWIWYLASQVGEDPSVYLPTSSTFSPPPVQSKLRYFKGTEEFSNIYDTPDIVAVAAVRYWVYQNRSSIDSTRAGHLINLTKKYLHATWAIYGMGAGEGPVWKYDMGSRQGANGAPEPARTPVPPPGTARADYDFDPTAPRKGSRYIYTGHFIALAGARSKLGGHWNYDYRLPLFDRAIEQLGSYVPLKNPPPEFALLDKLQTKWAGLQSPPTGENLYGLTAADKQNLDALLHNCYYASSSRICPSAPQYAASGFQNWLKSTYQPWLSTVRIATTYRILGGSGWRASLMEANTNGNTTNVYAVYYQANVLDGGTHSQATFLFPWYDRNGGIPGSCTFDQSTGRVTAQHDAVIMRKPGQAPRVVHPAATVWMDIPTGQPLVQLVLSPDNAPVFGSGVVAKSLANVFTPGGTAFGNDVAWVSSDVPEGGVMQGAYEGWNWVTDDPLPYTEADRVHLSSPVAGLHQHFFTGATDNLTIDAGDTLYAYVYLDPSNPPSEVMLQWFDPSAPGAEWEHRAYWGANFIGWGTDGQNSRRYVGALPAAGDWVRLEVPASLLGLEGRTVTGMAFTLYGGAAAWDDAGKSTLLAPLTNVATGGAATQSSTYLSYTGAPLAIDGNTDGNFFDNSVTHTNAEYQPWWQLDLGATYAIDTINLWNRTDCCAERLSNFYILVSEQPFVSNNLTSTLSQPGVTSYYVSGQGGYPTAKSVQRSGRYVRVQLTGTNYLSLAEVEVLGRPTQPPSGEVVWVEDSIPAGATTVSGGWNWISSGPSPASGAAAHQSALMAGGQQHFFSGAADRLTVNAGDKLITYVYLDPQNPPSEIMLQWFDPSAPGAEWEHRAYWGANIITTLGTDGTDSRRYMGSLPPVGQWVPLEVPAFQVGLEGRTLSGMAFTQWDGRVTWDHSGKRP